MMVYLIDQNRVVSVNFLLKIKNVLTGIMCKNIGCKGSHQEKIKVLIRLFSLDGFPKAKG